MALRETADIVVVGGGIMGVCTALAAAKSGAKVVLVEKDHIGSEQSSRNLGFTRQQGRHAAEIDLARRSVEMWNGLSDEFGEDTTWRRTGSMMLGTTEASLTDFESWAVVGRSHGIPVEILEDAALHDHAPYLGPDWVAGMYTSSDGQADPGAVMDAYARALPKAGCTVRESSAATRLLTARGAVAGVSTPEGDVFAPRVVVAGGTWTRRLLSTVNVRIPIQWVRSAGARTEPMPPTTSAPIWVPGVAFRQGLDGRITFGPGGASDIDIMPSAAHDIARFLPTWRQNAKMGLRLSLGRAFVEDVRRGKPRTGRYDRSEPSVNLANIERSRQILGKVVPEWRDVRVERAWGGYIDGTPDALPIISRIRSLHGLLVVAGFSGTGFGLGPAVGEAVSDVALTGQTSFDLEPFSLTRFGGGSLGSRKVH